MKCIHILSRMNFAWRFSLIVSFIVLFSHASFAQTAFGKKPVFKTISFGETIDFGELDNSVRWTVSGKMGSRSFTGSEINKFVFETPGTYEIRFSESKKHSDGCNHPAFDENMTVEVSPVKMIFDFSKIVFSDEITSGRSLEGISVTVPVAIKLSKEAPKSMQLPEMTGAGIGVNIVAKPVNTVISLSEGTTKIVYRLSGIASSPEYIMLDFKDVNNQTQTYYLPQRLK